MEADPEYAEAERVKRNERARKAYHEKKARMNLKVVAENDEITSADEGSVENVCA